MESGACPQASPRANTSVAGGDIPSNYNVSDIQHSRAASPAADIESEDLELEQVTNDGDRLRNLWKQVSSADYQFPWVDRWGQRLSDQPHDADFYAQSWFNGLLAYTILSATMCAAMLLLLAVLSARGVAVMMIAQVLKGLVWFCPSVLVYAAMFIRDEDSPSAADWFIKKVYHETSPETRDKYLKRYIGVVVSLLLAFVGLMLFNPAGVPRISLPGSQNPFQNAAS